MYNLSNIHGRKVLTGTDDTGMEWTQFELDYHWNENRATCKDCGRELEYGWVQDNDSQYTVCDNEIQYVTKRSHYFLDDIPLVPLSTNVNPLKTHPDTKYWLLN